ncbi:MAG TPA: acyltransferase [Verrucomicrobiae bacterium]|nr:acyltransferase [Verrucomicrobiae bacterium]
MSGKPRLDDVDSAKGLAIVLVVFGHLVAWQGGNFPKGFAWYMVVDQALYRFHMSFFMFLSGFVFFYAYNPIRTLRDYRGYAVRKFWRFVPAYLLFGGLMIVGKVIGQRFLHVQSPPESFWRGLEEILIRPMASHAASLWYIYALLVFQLLAPVALRLSRDRLEPLLGVALVLHFVGGPTLFCLDRVTEHAFVFVAAGYAAARSSAWMAFVDRFFSFTLTTFIAVLVASVYWSMPSYPIALLSIPALHGLCRVPRWRSSSWLLLCGKYTFVIYLMNTMVIGIEKGLLEKLHLWTGPLFVFSGPLLLASGVFVPILLKIYVFPKIPRLDRITS